MENKFETVFGFRAVYEALNSDKNIDKILVKRGIKSEQFNEIKEVCKNNDVLLNYVPIEKLNRLTRKNHQGIIAFISPVEYVDIENLLPQVFEKGKNPFFIVLDGITDVRNFGAIARSAECFNADGIIIPTKGAADISSDAVKTSAGALMNIPVSRVSSLKNTLQYFKDSGLKVIAASEKAELNIFDIDCKDPIAIVMGSEEKGVSASLLQASDYICKIPIAGNVNSLNVSVASGVISYEIIRQRS